MGWAAATAVEREAADWAAATAAMVDLREVEAVHCGDPLVEPAVVTVGGLAAAERVEGWAEEESVGPMEANVVLGWVGTATAAEEWVKGSDTRRPTPVRCS